MQVIKRDGTREKIHFDKIVSRITHLCRGTDVNGVRYGPALLTLDPIRLSMSVIAQIKDGISTRELDEYTAESAATLTFQNPEYSELASRILISNHHKNTVDSFSITMKRLYEYKDKCGKPSPLISRDLYKLVERYGRRIDAEIDYLRDYNITFDGFKTLERSYLIKYQSGTYKVQERPQHMWMRKALGIFGPCTTAMINSPHKADIEEMLTYAFRDYHYTSRGYYINATPTLYNAGTPNNQLSSCFLLGIPDNLLGIYHGVTDCAMISKHAGGMGVHISQVRASGSYIHGTNGHSNGIIPMLKVFSDTAKYVDQGGGKRMGSIAMYIEPWHPEIMEFLQAKLPTGHEERRVRNLFYGNWIPDLFMRRVAMAVEEETKARTEGRTKKVVMWSTFCPDECPGLADVWGTKFDELYEKYESEGKARSQLDIMKIWRQIIDNQKESGGCYLLFKDAANAKSNQQNIGTIKSSNLCTEIIEYSDEKEYATCNLASISLPRFAKLKAGETDVYEIDHETLYEIAYFLTINLNRVIDVNYYPVDKTKISNERHRPIGIGVQGMADMFHIMHIPFDSPEAFTINRDIFETIYYAALKASNDLAKRDGAYSTFKGSPASKGILQFDMWNYKPVSGRYDWTSLKELIVKYGLRNSLLLAPMPTASTSAILGNTECFEPISYNIYVKRVLSGEFVIVNKHLQRDLIKLGLWNENLRERLIKTRGSLQDEKLFSDVPAHIRNQYKTAFEIKQKVLIDMAAARGVFIDQSQSLNLFVKSPTDSVLTSMHLYSWKLGLKTGLYYLRRDTVAKAQAFTVAPRNFSEKVEEKTESAAADVETAPEPAEETDNEENIPMCKRDDPTCQSCSG